MQRYASPLAKRWHYVHLHETSFGMDRTSFNDIARTADLFLNVSGACVIPDNLNPDCTKVFLDTDPGYNQIMLSERLAWSQNVNQWCASVSAHDKHFTLAENIHGTDCLIPKMEYGWQPTRVPVVTDVWESIAQIRPPQGAPWSTIMTWDAFQGKLLYKGVEYKSKGPEFEKLIRVPRLTNRPFTVAVGGVNTPFKWLQRYGLTRLAGLFSYLTRRQKFRQLAKHGWQIMDGPTITVTPESYQAFIGDSRGELSPAKHVYVATRSGWFSSRTACYLAAGRPVVVQDTGFPKDLPVGEGLMTFDTADEAVAAVREVEGNYERHAKAARAIAAECFDSDKILRQLIERALCCIDQTNQPHP